MLSYFIRKEERDSLNNFVFEVIRFNQDPDKPKEFDVEPWEEERLKAEGCTIKETRVTSAETGRTIVRRYS